jgi:hypothetical protein
VEKVNGMCEENDYPEINVTDLIDLLIECEKEQGVITLEEIKQAWEGLVVS